MATLTPTLTLTSTDASSDALSLTVTDSLTVTNPSTTWKCISPGNCQDPGDGTGTHASYCDCVQADEGCCGEGVAYAYDCQDIPPPATLVYGCMDDGTTMDEFIIGNRPPGWIGPATNYYMAANVHDCSCLYTTITTTIFIVSRVTFKREIRSFSGMSRNFLTATTTFIYKEFG